MQKYSQFWTYIAQVDSLPYFPIQQIFKQLKLAIKQNQICKSNGNYGMSVKTKEQTPNQAFIKSVYKASFLVKIQDCYYWIYWRKRCTSSLLKIPDIGSDYLINIKGIILKYFISNTEHKLMSLGKHYLRWLTLIEPDIRPGIF